MRICLPTGIFPPDIGGPASYVPRIAGALTSRGHAVEVITLSDGPAALREPYAFRVHRLPRRLPRLYRMARTIATIADVSRHADVVFASGLFIEAAHARGLVHRPLIMKVVGDWAWERACNLGASTDTLEEFQTRAQSPRVEAVRRLRTWVTRQADLVLVPSQYLRQLVAGWGIPPARLKCIYNAVDSLDPDPTFSPPAFDGRTIITVARLVPWKGIDSLIGLLPTRPRLRLVIVGEGPMRDELIALANALGVSSRVAFTGPLDSRRVASWLREADLFVLNSSYEGLPHVILEAFAVGLAVLATRVGGVAEAVDHGNTGWLVPPGDAPALGEAVDRLLGDGDLRKRLAKGGREALSERFQWDRLVDQTEQVLLEALYP